MDSPIRKTKEEDKLNRRMEIRGGLLREVWDEPGKTAVWDLTDRNGNLLGEQSWDEYEQYLDELIQRKQDKELKEAYKKTPESLDERRARAEKRRYLRSYGNRDALNEVLQAYLDDNPQIEKMVSVNRFVERIMPYMNELMSVQKVTLILRHHREFFEEKGWTFSKGYSIGNRNECMYVGYLSAEIDEDKHRKKTRDELIKELVKGENFVSRKELVDKIFPSIEGTTKQNLSGILIRNAYRYGLTYSIDEDMFYAI